MTVVGSIPHARSAACSVQPARRPSDQLTPMARARGERRSPTKTRWDTSWLAEAQGRTPGAAEEPAYEGEQRADARVTDSGAATEPAVLENRYGAAN